MPGRGHSAQIATARGPIPRTWFGVITFRPVRAGEAHGCWNDEHIGAGVQAADAAKGLERALRNVRGGARDKGVARVAVFVEELAATASTVFPRAPAGRQG